MNYDRVLDDIESSDTLLNYIEELKQRDRRENYITVDEVRDAIEHHLQQLQKLGATIEDDVCIVLRKIESSIIIREQIEKVRERLDMITELLKPFIHVRVHYADGNITETPIRLTPVEAIDYYLGKEWPFYDSLTGEEYKTIANKVEILSRGKTIISREIKRV